MPSALEIRVTVRDQYGCRVLHPANEQARALAQIAGTKTLRSQDLLLAKQHLGAVIVTEETDAAYVAALLT